MPDVLYDVDGAVATITLNRPDRLNAMGGQLIPEALDTIERAAGDDAVRVVVLTGAGRGFCAGGDLTGGAGGGLEGPMPELLGHVRGVADKLLAKAPVALGRIKANLNDAEHVSFTEALDHEADRHVRTSQTSDAVEAARAFVEKRPPTFTGR